MPALHTTYQWLLAIEGLEHLYGSHAAPAGYPVEVDPSTTGRAFVPYALIPDRVKPQSADTLDLQSSLSTGGSFSMEVWEKSEGAGDLLRLGPQGADRILKLDTSIEQLGAASVVVDVLGDLAGWSVNDQAHIGLEAMIISVITPGSPQQLTLIREEYNSRRQSHSVVSDDEGGAPIIYSDAIAWRGRPATLYAADSTSPSADDWFEVVRGYVREAPTEGDPALTVGITVCPWQNALTLPLEGSGVSTGFQHGLHLFDGVNASVINLGYHFFDEGDAYRDPLARVDSVSAVALRIFTNWTSHTEYFDPTSTRNALRGRMNWQNHVQGFLDSTGLAYGGSGYNNNSYLQFEPGTVFPVVAPGADWYGDLKNTVARYRAEFDIYTSEAVVAWPDYDGINAEMAYATSGSTVGTWWWCNHAFEEGGTIACTLSGESAPSRHMSLYLQRPLDDPRFMWYGVSVLAPDAPVADRRRDQPRDGSRFVGDTDRIFQVAVHRGSEDAEPFRAAVRGFADAFYQTGEKYLLLKDDLSNGGGPGKLTVSWKEADGAGHEPVAIEYSSAVAASTITGGAAGTAYILTDPDNVPSMGDWPGQELATFSPAPTWKNTRVRDVLLELLFSSEGNGYTSATYDVQPLGLGLLEDEVDSNSFIFAGYYLDDVERFRLLEETTLEEVIGSMLRVNGVALVTRLDPSDNRRKLALIPCGAVPTARDSILTITNGDWDVGNRPSTQIERNIENVLELEVGPDPITGETTIPVRIVSKALVKANQRKVEAYSDVVSWLTLDAYSTSPLVRVALRRWALFGSPRILLAGTIPAGYASGLYPGAVITVSADDARTYSGRGISQWLARVTSVEFDPQGARCDLEVSLFAESGEGYSPAMKVSFIDDATTVTVRSNTYSFAYDWVTGVAQTDAGFFAVGDSVEGFDPANYAGGASSLTVLSIVGNTVTFTAAHGLSVGDVIHAANHGANPATLDDYAEMDVGDVYA